MKVAIIMGSNSDWPILEPAEKTLKEFGVEVEVVVASAHRTPDVVHEFAAGARERGVEVIIAAAGAAAHLRGQKPVPRRAGTGNMVCHAGACTEDAELRLRASGGRANDPGAGVGAWQCQGQKVLRISAESPQAEGRRHRRSDGAAAERV